MPTPQTGASRIAMLEGNRRSHGPKALVQKGVSVLSRRLCPARPEGGPQPPLDTFRPWWRQKNHSRSPLGRAVRACHQRRVVNAPDAVSPEEHHLATLRSRMAASLARVIFAASFRIWLDQLTTSVAGVSSTWCILPIPPQKLCEPRPISLREPGLIRHLHPPQDQDYSAMG
jgi:hypothetical protein